MGKRPKQRSRKETTKEKGAAIKQSRAMKRAKRTVCADANICGGPSRARGLKCPTISVLSTNATLPLIFMFHPQTIRSIGTHTYSKERVLVAEIGQLGTDVTS